MYLYQVFTVTVCKHRNELSKHFFFFGINTIRGAVRDCAQVYNFYIKKK